MDSTVSKFMNNSDSLKLKSDSIPNKKLSKNLPKIEPSIEEKAFRKRKKNSVKIRVLKCSVCDCVVEKIRRHPLFDTLICRKCLIFYTSEDFVYDSNGEDLFCRMCADGGSLVLCTNCPHAICKNCLLKHSKKSINRIRKNPKWKCFICDVSPLYMARLVYDQAKKNVHGKNRNLTSKQLDKIQDDLATEQPSSSSSYSQKAKFVLNKYSLAIRIVALMIINILTFLYFYL